MVVSVIIPTLGRSNLVHAVRSVLMQNVPVQIIIVNDSGSPLSRQQLPDDVTVLDTSGRTGAANARNLALENVTGEFIAFLDDDDEWLRGHLDDAIRVLRERREVDIYSCRSLVVDEDGMGRLEPADLLQEGAIVEHLYGSGNWRKRSRRIITPTLVFRAHLAANRQDVSMRRRQDLWWLLTAERDLGARLYQSSHIGVVVYVDRPRQNTIDASADHFAWAQRLDEIQPGSGASQVISRARTATRAGAPEAFPSLLQELHRLPHGKRQIPVLVLHYAAATAVKVSRSFRRR